MSEITDDSFRCVLQGVAEPGDLADPLLDDLGALCRGPDYAEQLGGVLAAGGGCCGNLGIIRGMSAQLLKEGEKLVGRPVAARAGCPGAWSG
jgi:hypothetical protein